MKSVFILNGSPRRQHTLRLCDEIARALDRPGIQVSLLNLGDYEIRDCAGCEACIMRTSRCGQKDGAAEIMARMVASDGVVLAAPVYMANVPGKLKSLIDKTAWWMHRPQLAGKPVLVAATTAGSGLKQVLGYLESVAIQWGMQPAGRIGRSLTAHAPVTEAAVRRFAWHLDAPRSQYRPSLPQLTLYQVQRVLAMKVLPLDRAYWTQRGWDQRIYYYDCRIDPARRLIARALYRILWMRVNPVIAVPAAAPEGAAAAE
jgi:multimeric flavodoxin WrbA